jgi:tetratricopeptide (TPR) repeat protein
MLPPRDVPAGLSAADYQKLAIRYQMLKWPKQMAASQRYTMAMAGDAVPEETRRKVGALMAALEITFTVNDAVNTVRGTIDEVARLAGAQAGKVLDKNETLAKAKRNVGNVFSLVNDIANSALHKVVEDVLLPRMGLPVDFIPEGLSAAEYLKMGARYEQIGFAEQARKALLQASKVSPESPQAKRARIRLATRIPRERVSDDATRRYVDSLKLYLTQEIVDAKAKLELLIREYPDFEWPYIQLGHILLTAGEVDRAQDLALKVTRQNQAMIKAWLMLATIDIIYWKISDLDKHLKKVRSLDPESPELATFEQLLELITQQGLR